jgi:hypothetical protein
MTRISYDRPANIEGILEAVRRQEYDGIPRHVYVDGKIMKWDWELPEGVVVDIEGEALEDHIRRLIDGQQG